MLGKALPPSEVAARQTRQLLARYGVVTRLSLEDEIGAWDWGGILRQLKRMEMRGELRRGYFVQGMPGMQFALPEVVEQLRALRDLPDDEALVLLNACDPANRYGPALDDGPLTAGGEPLAFARVPSTWLVQHRGLPILVVGNTFGDVTTLQGADEGLVARALHLVRDHLATFERRLTVETWNGGPILETSGVPLLEALGFVRSYPVMEWRRPIR